MAERAEKITETFNGQNEWQLAGGYFKLMSTVQPVDVELYDRGLPRLKALAVEGGFYQRIPFDKVRIKTLASEAVSFLVAPDEGGSDRFTGTFSAQGTLGTLLQQTVNGFNALVVKVTSLFNDDVTAAGEAFVGTTVIAALAANLNHSQLHNPAASGRVLYVDSIENYQAAAGEVFRLYHHNVALGAVQGAAINKNAGGTVGVAELRALQSAGVAGTYIRDLPVLAGDMKCYTFDPPFRLEAGENLLVSTSSLNIATRTPWSWREKTT